MFSKESLETLRSRIDLVEVLHPHLSLKKQGSSYKALCPFHEEKTPSFLVHKGDSHYHCFGCGAHGDAIEFLMSHLRMSFSEAVESLAEKFQVPLEEIASEKKGPSKMLLREVLQKAASFYHAYLLHTLEGHAALEYLYSRGIDLSFIEAFQLGLSPKRGNVLQKVLFEEKVSPALLEEVGLFTRGKDFFSDRIMIPIMDGSGHVVGFSARKFKEETFGGKYVNTPETPLFKKSKILFGMSYARKTIARLKKVLLVEGQIDALRLLHNGYLWTLAGQGTAFGAEHVQELKGLGVVEAYLALDGDSAGKEAGKKWGHLLQKEGIEVKIVTLPDKMDPDLFLREKGKKGWDELLEKSVSYLPFLVQQEEKNLSSPAEKNRVVQTIAAQIRSWDSPLMVHESLRVLARLTHTPEHLLLVDAPPARAYVPKSGTLQASSIDPDRIVEADVLRWLLTMGDSHKDLYPLAKKYLVEDSFQSLSAKSLFRAYCHAEETGGAKDLLSLAMAIEGDGGELLLEEIVQKRINRERALVGMGEAVQKLLERNWMRHREEIKLKIYSGRCTEEEVLLLAKEFDLLKNQRPVVVV